MPRFDHIHLFVGTPCYGGVVTQAYTESLLALVVEGAAARLRLSVGMLGQDALITRSRNTLLGQFMRTDATHLLFVDADIGFAPADVFALLGRDVAMVGGLYPIRASHWGVDAHSRFRGGEAAETACFDYVGEPAGPARADGLLPARYAGTGFLLIAREAIGRMIEAYPETRCRHAHVAGTEMAREVHALFDCMIEPLTRHYLSEDYAFCARWRAIGGDLWLDPSARLSHHGMSEFRGAPEARHAASAAFTSG